MKTTTRNRLLLAGVLFAAVSVTLCARPPASLPSYMPPTPFARRPTSPRPVLKRAVAADDTGDEVEPPDPVEEEAPEDDGRLRCVLPPGLESATEAGLVFAPRSDDQAPMVLGLPVTDGAIDVMSIAFRKDAAWITLPGLGVVFLEVEDGACVLTDPLSVTDEAIETRCPLSLPDGFEASFSALPGDDRDAIVAYLDGGPAPVLYDTFGTVEDDTLIISGAPSGTGELWLTAGEVSIDLPVQWQDGRCDPPIEIPTPATVSGTVGPLLDATSAHVEVCERAASVHAADPHYTLLVWPGPCEATASRRDGVLTAHGEIVPFTAAPGDEITIDLALPAEKVGGMGFRMAEHPDGIVLEEVYPGNPAADAGLQAGDIITAIDGEPADELSTEGFVRLGVGPIGTDVTVTVRRADGAGEEEDIILSRDELVMP